MGQTQQIYCPGTGLQTDDPNKCAAQTIIQFNDQNKGCRACQQKARDTECPQAFLSLIWNDRADMIQRPCNKTLPQAPRMSAEDLEAYFANDPTFEVGQPPDLITQGHCLGPKTTRPPQNMLESVASKLVPIPPPLVKELERKNAVAEYYLDKNKIKEGQRQSFEEIAKLDLLLERPPLSDTECNAPGTAGNAPTKACMTYKNCGGLSSGQKLRDLTDTIKENLSAYRDLQAARSALEFERISMSSARQWAKASDVHSQEDALDEAIRAYELKNPIVKGKFLKDANVQDNHFADLVKKQLEENRQQMTKHLGDLRSASRCLDSPNGSHCEKFDETMRTTPELPSMYSSTSPLLEQSSEGALYLDNMMCHQEVRDSTKKRRKIAMDVAANAALVAASLIATDGGSAVPILLRAKSIYKAGQTAKLLPAAASAAVLGLDLFNAGLALQQAFTSCEESMGSLATIQTLGKGRGSGPSCPSQSAPTVTFINEYNDCVNKHLISVAMAAIPVATSIATTSPKLAAHLAELRAQTAVERELDRQALFATTLKLNTESLTRELSQDERALPELEDSVFALRNARSVARSTKELKAIDQEFEPLVQKTLISFKDKQGRLKADALRDLELKPNRYKLKIPPGPGKKAFSNAGQFMNDPRKFINRLQELELEVYERSLRTGEPREVALENILQKWENANGFKQTIDVDSTLSGDQFHQMIASKQSFRDWAYKDVARDGSPHSAQAHRIQVNCLMRDMRDIPEKYSDVKDAGELYKMFGDSEFLRKVQRLNPSYYQEGSLDSLWDVYFDRLPYKNTGIGLPTGLNFSSPEFLRRSHNYFPGLGNWY